MGYRSKYNRRLRAAKRLQQRLAIAALLCVTVAAAAFMTTRGTLPAAPGAEAEAAPARPVVQAVAALAAPSAHVGARRVYPFSIVPGGVSGREEVVHVLQTDQVVAQHYAGLQVARLATVTVSKPRAVYVSYRKGDKVYWTSQKMMLAQGETLLTDGSNEVRGRCGNRISDTPRLPVEANGPTMAMLDASMDLDADDGDDGERQASTSSSDTSADAGAGSASDAGQPQPQFLAGYTYSGVASSYARPPMLLAMPGIGGGAPLSRPATLSATPTTLVSTQTSVTSDSSVSSGTPGTTDTNSATGATGATAGDTSGSGTGGATGTGTGGGDPGTTSGTPPKTTPLPAIGDPSDDTTTVDMPPLPESLSETGSLPVIVPKAPAKSSQVPEPDSLWLSGVALAAVLLARRTPRRVRQG